MPVYSKIQQLRDEENRNENGKRNNQSLPKRKQKHKQLFIKENRGKGSPL
jgi:hypothetical protein